MISGTFSQAVSNTTVDLLANNPELKYIPAGIRRARYRVYAVQSAANISLSAQKGTSFPFRNSSPSVLAAAPSIDVRKDLLGEFPVKGGDVISLIATEPGTASTTIRIQVQIL